jgi:hypothetical protein
VWSSFSTSYLNFANSACAKDLVTSTIKSTSELYFSSHVHNYHISKYVSLHYCTFQILIHLLPYLACPSVISPILKTFYFLYSAIFLLYILFLLAATVLYTLLNQDFPVFHPDPVIHLKEYF